MLGALLLLMQQSRMRCRVRCAAIQLEHCALPSSRSAGSRCFRGFNSISRALHCSRPSTHSEATQICQSTRRTLSCLVKAAARGPDSPEDIVKHQRSAINYSRQSRFCAQQPSKTKLLSSRTLKTCLEPLRMPRCSGNKGVSLPASSCAAGSFPLFQLQCDFQEPQYR